MKLHTTHLVDFMTHSDSITGSLALKVSDLKFPKENYIQEGISKLTGLNKALIFKATYLPKQTVCPNCGVIAGKRPVRAYHVSEVLLTPSGHRPRILSLRKAKYDCTDCGAYLTPSPYFIDAGATISSPSPIKATIFMESKVKMSMKDLARRYFVSPTFCWDILDQIPLKQKFISRPEVLCFDEFKATQNSDNSLAFVYSDGTTHALLNILESRKQKDLMAYFFKFPRAQKLKVKKIVMDMNASYPALIPLLFPNAHIIIDRFHLVRQLSRAFNQWRNLLI